VRKIVLPELSHQFLFKHLLTISPNISILQRRSVHIMSFTSTSPYFSPEGKAYIALKSVTISVNQSVLQIWSLQKLEFSLKFQFIFSSFLFRDIQTESANHAESTGDVQEKSAGSYELEFAEKRRICELRISNSHF
jgi:hypothetical protein